MFYYHNNIVILSEKGERTRGIVIFRTSRDAINYIFGRYFVTLGNFVTSKLVFVICISNRNELGKLSSDKVRIKIREEKDERENRQSDQNW